MLLGQPQRWPRCEVLEVLCDLLRPLTLESFCWPGHLPLLCRFRGDRWCLHLDRCLGLRLGLRLRLGLGFGLWWRRGRGRPLDFLLRGADVTMSTRQLRSFCLHFSLGGHLCGCWCRDGGLSSPLPVLLLRRHFLHLVFAGRAGERAELQWVGESVRRPPARSLSFDPESQSRSLHRSELRTAPRPNATSPLVRHSQDSSTPTAVSSRRSNSTSARGRWLERSSCTTSDTSTLPVSTSRPPRSHRISSSRTSASLRASPPTAPSHPGRSPSPSSFLRLGSLGIFCEGIGR